MPLPFQVTDPCHGHIALFHAESAKLSASSDITWGPASIHIPSQSCLNGPADIWLHLPTVNAERAAHWCKRTNTLYLGQWHKPDKTLCGFGFRVSHFSKYGYVDSDPESDDDQTAKPAQPPPALQAPSSAEKERPGARQARLLRAGSTPARRRPVRPPVDVRNAPDTDAPPTRAPPPAPRPRMSTRVIVDLEDTDPGVDADVDDDETFETDGMQDRPSYGYNIPTENPDESFEGRPAEESIAQLDVTSMPRPSGRDHRTLTFQDQVDDVVPLPRWSSEMGSDAPSIHRLREVLFTPHQSSGKSDRALQDVDMAEVSSSLKVDAPEDDHTDIITLPFPSDIDAEDWAGREALDFMSDQPREGQLLANFYPSSVLPFPTLDVSVTAEKQRFFSHPGLALGRSFRFCFSTAGEIVSPVFIPSTGFNIASDHIHAYVQGLFKASFSTMLAAHCVFWYNCSISGESDIGVVNGMEDEGQRYESLVRRPSFVKAFRSGGVADSVMEQIIGLLRQLHSTDGDENALHAQIAFGMLLALYKSEKNVTEDHGRSQLLRRLAQWATGAAGTAFDRDSGNETDLRKAVISLALGKVEEAVDLAIEHGHMRLAVLMARALEAPKHDLREDALSQLEMYGLRTGGGNRVGLDPNMDDSLNDGGWDEILQFCDEDANVCINERMILLILGGHVAPVARYLGFSWYRLFIMELLHGAGSSDGEQWQRVAAAVRAVSQCGIDTYAPHGQTNDMDVVYQQLKLYAENIDKHGLTSGMYSNSSIGGVHRAMDYRFSWLLHQTLTALIPEASPKNGCVSLADGLSTQLKGHGVHLWSFYVLCCGGGGEKLLKQTLVRNWPSIEKDEVGVRIVNGKMETEPNADRIDDQMNIDEEGDLFEEESRYVTNAEEFLKIVLNVPDAWICEAKAVAAGMEGNKIEECTQWLKCGEGRGAQRCHKVIMEEVVPRAVVRNEVETLQKVEEMLIDMERMKEIPNWSCNGGMVLSYLRYVAGVTRFLPAGFEELRDVASCVSKYVQSVKLDVERCAGTMIADGVVTAQRAFLMRVDYDTREKHFMAILGDLEQVPCSRSVRLRLSGEYTIAARHGWPHAQRIAAAFPAYRKYLA